MAAVRAFSLPEILEAILMWVSIDAMVEEAEYSGAFQLPDGKLQKGWSYRLEPTATLAILSGVDRTFLATIKGSPRLQRVASGDKSPALGLCRFCPSLPLQWLAECAIGFKSWGADDINDLNFARGRMLIRRCLNDFVKREGKQPEASWWRVKVHQDPAPRTLEIFTGFQGPKDYDGRACYSDYIEVGAGVTLGALFLDISSIMKRSKLEHVARVQALEAQARKAP